MIKRGMRILMHLVFMLLISGNTVVFRIERIVRRKMQAQVSWEYPNKEIQ